MKIPLISSATLALLASISTSANSAPDSLPPPAIYDNVGNGASWGQTFIAEKTKVSGVEFFIGDPNRPDNPCCNELTGVAYLDLYDASNSDAPVLLAHKKIQGKDKITFGQTTFCFNAPITVTVGQSYFITVVAADKFGLGLQDQNNSTYNGGAEAYISGGKLIAATGNRDTSFSIKNKRCSKTN